MEPSWENVKIQVNLQYFSENKGSVDFGHMP